MQSSGIAIANSAGEPVKESSGASIASFAQREIHVVENAVEHASQSVEKAVIYSKKSMENLACTVEDTIVDSKKEIEKAIASIEREVMIKGAKLRQRALKWRRMPRCVHPSVLLSEINDPGVGRSLALLRHYIMSLEFQLFMAVLILVNAAFMIVEAVGENKAFKGWTVGFLLHLTTVKLYTVEILLNMFAFGTWNFWRNSWNWLQVCVVPVMWLFLFMRFEGGLHNLPIALKVIPVLDELLGGRFLVLALRKKVSKNKHRYIHYVENFDLDLTFITDDLIAMGVPTVGIHTLYRNPLSEVDRFFMTKFQNNFRIYNACPEMPYPDTLFNEAGGAVIRLQIQDHTPPTMDQFVDFLIDAYRWKGENANKAIAIHCKAGKGRTGSLCCAWLMYAKHVKSADDALSHFADCRTDPRLRGTAQGVETPSQVRYVKQLWQHLQRNASWFPEEVPTCEAPRCYLHTLEFMGGLILHPEKLGKIKLLVQCGGGARGLERVLETTPVEASLSSFDLGGAVVSGDVRISIFKGREKDFSAHDVTKSAANLSKAPGVVFYLLFHTGFMSTENDQQQDFQHIGIDIEASQQASSSIFRVPVEGIDKAKGKPKKHAPGSSLVLRYSAPARGESLQETGSKRYIMV